MWHANKVLKLWWTFKILFSPTLEDHFLKHFLTLKNRLALCNFLNEASIYIEIMILHYFSIYVFWTCTENLRFQTKLSDFFKFTDFHIHWKPCQSTKKHQQHMSHLLSELFTLLFLPSKFSLVISCFISLVSPLVASFDSSIIYLTFWQSTMMDFLILILEYLK